MRKKTDGKTTMIAINAEGAAPEWIELLPPGETVTGRDGRSWVNSHPGKVVAAFAANMAPIPVDWEHATELLAPNGQPAPAAGWVEAMEIRDGGSVWGKISWTERGADMVRNGEYKFVSPVLVYDKLTRQIVAIDSVGLTNKHNLHLTALNREDGMGMQKGEFMNAIGMDVDATFDEAIKEINKIKTDLAKAANQAGAPSLEKFVPRADYDLAVSRAANAEATLKAQADAAMAKEIDTEVNAAVAAGKITPATADYYRSQCKLENGLESFRKFVAVAPVIGAPSQLDGKSPEEGGQSKELNRATEIAAMFGNSAEDLKKYAA